LPPGKREVAQRGKSGAETTPAIETQLGVAGDVSRREAAVDRAQHWNHVYTTKAPTEVSWFEADPRLSLDLIEWAAPAGGRIVDVGGGASLLVDRLLDRGFANVAVLDVSAAALAHAKERLGPRAAEVEWITGDVTALAEIGSFDVWHDRAVFHFLTDAADRRRYVDLALRTLPRGGRMIVGAFALDGPAKCSGLEVCRYDAASLGEALGPQFKLLREAAHAHTTPWGALQPFFFGVFERQ
jgi:SAM-dependent methyltransferase